MGCISKSGVHQAPKYRIKVHGEFFKGKKNQIFDHPLSFNLFQLLGSTIDISSAFEIFASGSYFFCSIISPAQIKLSENLTLELNEKYRKVNVLRNVKKQSDVELDANFFHFQSQMLLLEYLFFVLLYKYRAYIVFDVFIDFFNKVGITMFGYTLKSCVLRGFDVQVDQEILENGFPNKNVLKPLKVKLLLSPYDTSIRL